MRTLVFTAALVILWNVSQGMTSPSPASQVEVDTPPTEWIQDNVVTARLEGACKRSKIPGAVGAIVQLGEAARIGAHGVRRAGSDEAFTAADLVHIGSDTKAMTAVLIARLVQAKTLRWNSTVAEILPSIVEDIHPDFAAVTVRQLLLHRAGLPANPAYWGAFQGKEIRQRRLLFAKAAMAQKPLAKPGDKFLYSNLSVMIAGAMAEAAADATWEDLMHKEVFGPLGMDTAGFGIPGKLGELDQPWGHTEKPGGRFEPVQVDNDPALGPAGTVHLSMEDWAKFVRLFLADVGADDADPFLSADSMSVLLGAGPGKEPAPGEGMGWLLVDRDWAKGIALNHAGSNTTWFANAWVAPEIGVAFLVAVNAYGTDVPAVADRFVAECVTANGDKKKR